MDRKHRDSRTRRTTSTAKRDRPKEQESFDIKAWFQRTHENALAISNIEMSRITLVGWLLIFGSVGTLFLELALLIPFLPDRSTIKDASSRGFAKLLCIPMIIPPLIFFGVAKHFLDKHDIPIYRSEKRERKKRPRRRT